MTEGWLYRVGSLRLYTQPAVESTTMSLRLPRNPSVAYEGVEHGLALSFVSCKLKGAYSESSQARRGDALLLSRSHVSVASGGESCQGLRPIGWSKTGPGLKYGFLFRL